jgi:hypothetical protein
MYYAGGCASGIWFKIGEGKLGALLAIGGLMTGLVLTPKFATAPLFNFLNTGNTYLGNLYLLTRYASMIAMTLGLSLWLVLIRTPNSCPKSSSVSWKTTGSMLALISLLAWISSQLAGRAYGMGIIGGTLDLYQSVVTHSLPSIPWEMLFVLGIPVGSYLSAYKDHKFKIQAPAMNKLHRPILGGLGMGLGASIAGGCTVGYGIVGIPIFSFAGLTTFAAIVMGVQLRILLNKRLP